MKKKNLGFTLAEVLIVIGIIGVVAALTLPNLNHATGDKERVTKVKKIYSTLTEAFDRAQAIYGDFDTWYTDLGTNFCNEQGACDYSALFERAVPRIAEFMKVSKNCITDTTAGCVTSGSTKMLSAPVNYIQLSGFPSVLTPDGISIAFQADSISSLRFIIDIDGPNKGDFRFGKDLFEFYADSEDNQLKTMGANSTFSELLSERSKGEYMSTWIINYDNADYLKITDSNGTCDNGNVVTESNPSCN